MEKFYDNPAWRRIRGLRGVGILALSVAFCLTGLLALSSCDLEFWDDDDDEAAPEAVQMRGFYTSVSGDDDENVPDCTSEAVDLYTLGDPNVEEPNVRIQSTGTVFGETTFAGIGHIVGENIVTAYVSANDDGTFDRPGAYFLASVDDSDFTVEEGETVYAGYWTGYASRPDDEVVVICPYVLVPADALDADSCGMDDDPDDNLGVTNPAGMADELEKYLTDENGDLRVCHKLLENGVLSPTPVTE